MSNERMILFCAILTTLADLDAHHHSEVPQGHLYAGLLDRCTLSEFQAVVGLMLTSGLATIYPGTAWRSLRAAESAPPRSTPQLPRPMRR